LAPQAAIYPPLRGAHDFKAAGRGVEGIGFGIVFVGLALRTLALWLAILCYVDAFATSMAVLPRMNFSRAFPLTALASMRVPLLTMGTFGEHPPVMRMREIATMIAGGIPIGWKE
jgi:hypothetical protein